MEMTAFSIAKTFVYMLWCREKGVNLGAFMYKIIKKISERKHLLYGNRSKSISRSGETGTISNYQNRWKGKEFLWRFVIMTDIEEVLRLFSNRGRKYETNGGFCSGRFFADVLGPLGKESELLHEKVEVLHKKNIFYSGGVGTAPVYPQVKWMREQGCCVDVIIGSRNKESLILKKRWEKLQRMSIFVLMTEVTGAKDW